MPELPPNDASLRPETGWNARRALRLAAAAAGGFAILTSGAFAFYCAKYSSSVERGLASGPFSTTVNVFSAPRTVAKGDALTPATSRHVSITP
jgi:hypothetical protein